MRPFKYIQPGSIHEALAGVSQSGAQVIAGGSDLLSEIKDGTANPDILVGLSRIPNMKGITSSEDRISIGSMTTISEIADNNDIRENYTALAEAAAGLATPQIRNVGTLGGNLNQRPRCFYYRNPLTQCLKKGGDKCFAVSGHNKYMCITGGHRCYITHPSDTGVALSVFGAQIEVTGTEGVRLLPIDQFFVGPSEDILRETVLKRDEIVTAVHLDRVKNTGLMMSTYVKAREREGGDFALASVAATFTIVEGIIESACVAIGGVAPLPYRSVNVENYLTGNAVSAVNVEYASSLTISDPKPMSDNEYKIVLANNLVKKALTRLLEDC